MDQQQPHHHQQQQQQQRRFPTARSVSPELPQESIQSFSSNYTPRPPATNFRSQRITSPLSSASYISGAAPPLLLQPPTAATGFFPSGTTTTTTSMDVEMDQKLPPSSAAAPAADLPLATAQKKQAIGSIPMLPSFHIKERTAIQIPESTLSSSLLLDRILEYLRLHSISYECEPNTGCLECQASTDDVVGFGIQLWRAHENGQKVFWLEASRRDGCSIAMNAIRRSLIRHVRGEQQQDNSMNPAAPSAASLLGRRSHNDLVGSAASSPVNNPACPMSRNKRQRSLSPHRARLNCQDALSISLRLLNSTSPDQNELGLQSLTVITDPRLVDPTDAAFAARVVILGEGTMGVPLQFFLTRILQAVHPKKAHQQWPAAAAKLYHLTLHVLANALQVLEDNDNNHPINLACPLWQVVMECLLFSMDHADKHPHEATLAVKCIRHLLPATKRAVAFAQHSQQLNLSAMQASSTRALQFGKTHHKALEQESQRLLLKL
ncbi:expressed unknown protein [Seminavis robusta]|uniref:Uncharacterized protein n=1 Tax=Seminavis robusta TaxID=568900 RepID=A0A9N8E184_9STRA|nr:expressed unknown protein [Seminavis robusta]|eukprot:Sro457_g146960.1 n/a (493) ;mRNA; f:61421-62899